MVVLDALVKDYRENSNVSKQILPIVTISITLIFFALGLYRVSFLLFLFWFFSFTLLGQSLKLLTEELKNTKKNL